MTSVEFDFIVVGSGPSGVHAARELVRLGFKTAVLDAGQRPEDQPSHEFPHRSFSEIRRSNLNQKELFLGSNPADGLEWQKKAGAHLTPARRYMIHRMDEFFPIKSNNFFALQSTSVGGLGVSWGANCFRYTDKNLKKIGINPVSIAPYYREVASAIGVSGPEVSDISSLVSDSLELQKPLLIDENCGKILERYVRIGKQLNRKGFKLGQSAIAVLSRNQGERRANPMFDLDFWSDMGRSVYRPQHDLEQLLKDEQLTHLSGWIVETFEEGESHVSIQCRSSKDPTAKRKFTSRKLVLAAGAINSGKIVLKSIDPRGNSSLPILCNPNYWIAALNLPMLGKNPRAERYSLSQLTAIQDLGEDSMVSHFYSYRSLLYYRLIQDMPLPPELARIFLRASMTAMTMLNIHFSDRPSALKRVRLAGDSLQIQYELDRPERLKVSEGLSKMRRNLVSLRCIPFSTLKPLHGASIHYAGTLPSELDSPLGTTDEGLLRGSKAVFIADGSSWNYLPAEGLTFTLMANARRIARIAGERYRDG